MRTTAAHGTTRLALGLSLALGVAVAAGVGACDGSGGGKSSAGSGGSATAASGGKPGGSGGGSGSGGAASGGNPGSASGGKTGSGGATVSGGSTGTATGGATGSGGSTGTGGAVNPGGSGGVATGGSASGTGGSSGGVTGAGGGGGAAAGSGGSTGALHGGSSAKFICAPGATYPASPLTGMGAITMVMPDNATMPNYFAFVEGPLWIGSQGALFLSDNVSPERIWKLPGGLAPQVFLSMSGSNGLAVDSDDELIVADQAGKRITRIDPANAKSVTVVVPAGSYKPNDVLVRSDGNIYFTDPDSGFYWFSTKGTLSSAMKQVNRPNGLLLSLDENTLIVGDVGNKQIHTFTVGADGTVMTATDHTLVTAMNDTVDGMCMDCAGNIYAATSKGVEVYSSTGSYIGTIATGDTSNCTFGGTDRKTLFATQRSVVKAVTLGIPGLPD